MMQPRISFAFAAALALGMVAAGDRARAQEAEPSDRVVVRDVALAESPIAMVFFAFDRAELDRLARDSLDRVVAWMAENPDRELLIEGHTDPVGSPEYNLWLGEQRAQAVRTYLVDAGVPAERLRLVTMGEGRPVSARNTFDRRSLVRPVIPSRPLDEVLKPAEVARAEPPTADEEPTGTVGEPQSYEPPAEPEIADERRSLLDRVRSLQVSVGVGGGVQDFLDETTRDLTGVAGAWEVRVALGTRSRFAAEAAYFGAAQEVDALGLDNDAALIASGFEATARVNVTLDSAWQPYGFAGLGYMRFDVTGSGTENSNVESSENGVHMPLGVGVGYRFTDALRVDGRLTLRSTFAGNLTDGEGVEAADLGTWALGAKLAWEL